MRILLLIVLCLSGFGTNAATLGLSKEQFISGFLNVMASKNLDESLKKELGELSFGPSVFSNDSEAAVLSNTIMVLVDPNKDGVIDNAFIIYPAPRGGMDGNDLAVRRGFMTAIIGSENAYSKGAEFVLSTTGTRNDGRRIRKVDGFVIGSKNNGDKDQTQMLIILNESNKHPNASRKTNKTSKGAAGPNYFS